jgi:hypothetical protein
MGFALFGSIQRRVQSLCHGITQRLRQWTRPDSTSLAVGTALDLNRSKSERVLENALLRQQLVVLQRQGKRPCTGRKRPSIKRTAGQLA